MKIPNLKNVEAWRASTALPPGIHACRIAAVREGEKNGKPELQIDVADNEGRQSTDYMTISDSNLGRLKMFLQAAGINEFPDADADFDVTTLVGRNVMVVVHMEAGVGEYADREFPRVKGYKSPAEATEEEIPF